MFILKVLLVTAVVFLIGIAVTTYEFVTTDEDRKKKAYLGTLITLCIMTLMTFVSIAVKLLWPKSHQQGDTCLNLQQSADPTQVVVQQGSAQQTSNMHLPSTQQQPQQSPEQTSNMHLPSILIQQQPQQSPESLPGPVVPYDLGTGHTISIQTDDEISRIILSKLDEVQVANPDQQRAQYIKNNVLPGVMKAYRVYTIQDKDMAYHKLYNVALKPLRSLSEVHHIQNVLCNFLKSTGFPTSDCYELPEQGVSQESSAEQRVKEAILDKLQQLKAKDTATDTEELEREIVGTMIPRVQEAYLRVVRIDPTKANQVFQVVANAPQNLEQLRKILQNILKRF